MQVKLVNENFKTNYIDNLLLSRGIKNLENFKKGKRNWRKNK